MRLVAMCSAGFYCITSITIIACNKIVLTSYAFPSSSALACCQFIVTCIALMILVALGILEPMAYPKYSTLRFAAPLTALYLADVTMGLSATGAISLPMFTCLRRASIPMTMLLERWSGQNKPKPIIVLSVWGMVGGAIVAAYDDLAFDAKAYLTVFINDALTASRGVYVKSLLGGKLDKVSLLFYNATLSLALLAPYVFLNGHFAACRTWFYSADLSRRFALLVSSSLGPILQYAIFLCTQHNSALTTTVVGALKNIFTAYFGMILGGDYAYSLLNFTGISISCAASLVYSYAAIINRGGGGGGGGGSSSSTNKHHHHTALSTNSISCGEKRSSISSSSDHLFSSSSIGTAAALLSTVSGSIPSALNTSLPATSEQSVIIVDNLSPSPSEISISSNNRRRPRVGDDV
uniref:Sugar phosphate transporter domain-containing protein n=1 Tax=Aureoumbra lagunensis TaxID=44058 RepID=A0A7S3JZL4_9STRA|mmetsp:Transcript_12157/g.18272  ORF Transcript_12157/g.18272 Transcript_12157/m.18272 type:complete len:408 (+) Transcript_12157:77-1300(+)